MAVRSLWSSLRAAFASQTESLGAFTVANLIWLLAAALTSAAGRVYLPAYAVGLVLVPITCGLMRMAGHAARGNRVRARHLRHGMAHRFWTHLALGTGQFVLLTAASFNLGLGLGGQGLFLALVAVVAAYVAMGTGVVAAAAWPLLLDPYRSGMSWLAVLRLAVSVVVKRPLGLAALAVIEAALIAFTAQTVLLAFVLPAYGTLIAAHYVLPLADEVQGGTLPPREADSSSEVLPDPDATP